jgi:hypothetical protein
VSEERDVALLQVAYKCIIDLIGSTNQPGSKGRSDLYERVLLDGVLVGFTYAGQKIAFMLILLPQIPILYHELASVGVSYLKVRRGWEMRFAFIHDLCFLEYYTHALCIAFDATWK